jgi:hypothetical protein
MLEWRSGRPQGNLTGNRRLVGGFWVRFGTQKALTVSSEGFFYSVSTLY